MVWALSAALVAGILHRADVLAFAFALLLGFTWRSPVGRRGAAVLVALSLLLFAFGARDGAVYRARCAVVDSVSARLSLPIRAEGVVCSYPVWSPGGVRFEFDTHVGGVAQRLLVKRNAFDINYGDRLSLVIRLDPVSRMRRGDSLRGRGNTGSGRALSATRLPGFGGDPLTRAVLWPAHGYLRRAIARGCGGDAGIPMALLLGERGYLERWVRDAFSTLGISHLLALSGFHLGFVTVALLGMMRLFRVRNRGLVVVCLVAYVGIVGVILSLYRALVMVVLLVAASRLRRPLQPLTALCNAFLLMLLVYPHALYSLGFQLSFMATLAVLICVRRMRPLASRSRVRKFVHGVLSTLWVSAFVQVWVAPILLGSFGGVSLVAPVATVLFVFPVVVVLALAAAAAVVPPQVGVLFTCLNAASTAFEGLLRLALSWSPALAELPAPEPILYYLGFAALVLPRRNLWITAGGALAIVLSCAIPCFAG